VEFPTWKKELIRQKGVSMSKTVKMLFEKLTLFSFRQVINQTKMPIPQSGMGI
jgi:hypothetical protein